MNKKISIAFAITVIILVAGTLAFIFSKSDKDSGSEAYIAKNVGVKKVEKADCTKRAFDGEIKIKGWYVNEGENWFLRISNTDLEKLPAGYLNSKVVLTDGSDSLIAKLKKSSEKNPTELTIKGFYFNCEGISMVSVAPGEEVFKKYLTQK